MPWSRKHACCTCCSTTTTPHLARGLCRRCYLEKYRRDPTHTAKASQSKREWYVRNGGPDLAKRQREERHFSGNRETALERDDRRCTLCGESNEARLVVHHLDHQGRGSSRPNSVIDNLATLCRACHAQHHGTAPGWSREHAACRACGTTDVPHNARGLCRDCYAHYSYYGTLAKW